MTLSLPVQLTASSSTADATAYSTASVTPPASSRVYVIVTSGKASNLSQAPTGVSHPSMGALSLVQAQAVPNSNLTTSVWEGVGTGAAGAFTITHAVAMDNCIWHVVRFTSDVATPTTKQSAKNNAAATGTQSVSLPSAVTAGSVVLGALGLNLGSATAPSVGAGFTQLGSTLASTSPTTQQMIEYDATSPYSDVSFTVASASGRANIAIEVADGVVVAPAGGWFIFNGTAEVPATSYIFNGTTEVPATTEV